MFKGLVRNENSHWLHGNFNYWKYFHGFLPNFLTFIGCNSKKAG
jgi:hypothetical protein